MAQLFTVKAMPSNTKTAHVDTSLPWCSGTVHGHPLLDLWLVLVRCCILCTPVAESWQIMNFRAALHLSIIHKTHTIWQKKKHCPMHPRSSTRVKEKVCKCVYTWVQQYWYQPMFAHTLEKSLQNRKEIVSTSSYCIKWEGYNIN